MLGLIVRNALGPIKLGQSGFDSGQKYEPLNSIVDGGIPRHRLEGLNNAVAGKWLLHKSIVNRPALGTSASQTSHLTLPDNPLPYGCGSIGYNVCGFV